MSETRSFIDTNVLVYLLSADTGKADRAEEVIRAGATISVQVLNELTNVARHAQATTVWLRLRLADGDLLIEVTDDGVEVQFSADVGSMVVNRTFRHTQVFCN